MDWLCAIHYAGLVQLAENVRPDEECGSTVTVPLAGRDITYSVLTNIFANDLATDNNKARRELIVSMGYVAQDEDGNVVLAVRGTKGIHEWLHDCFYAAVKCPILDDAGHTEDGFTEVYLTLRVGEALGSMRLRDALKTMAFPQPVKSMTICGHSLGASLATLLALDVAANTQFKDVALYTYASPRTGDDRFVEVFNQYVPKTFRVANRMDLITEVPPAIASLAAPYRHVESTSTLVPDQSIGHHIMCQHHLSTYVYLMAAEAGVSGANYQLWKECRSENDHHWLHFFHHRDNAQQAVNK